MSPRCIIVKFWCVSKSLCFILLTVGQLPSCSSFGPPWIQGGMDGGQNYAHTMPGVAITTNEIPQDDAIFLIKRFRGGNVVSRDSPAILSVLAEFWNSAFQRTLSTLRNLPIPKGTQTQNHLLEQLRTLPVQVVTVPNSTVLPPEVVRVAIKRSGIIGNPLRADRVQELARTIKRWYVRNGFVLHSVTGANLKPDTATAEITVDEPIVSTTPVEITICKEMVVDDVGGLMTFRQYRDSQNTRKTFRHDRLNRKDLNTTYVETTGRTKPSKVARALGLLPGSPFQWSTWRWDKIVSSGVFGKVLRVAPKRLVDGTVQLQVYATEPPPRHLEYGLGKSLYTGSWEGEVDFEHQNLFGGGEVLGLMVRRGTKDVEPSIRLRYSDDRFGMDGGFDVEVFSDFLGDSPSTDVDRDSHGGQENDESSLNDDLCFRKGTTVRVRNPIKASMIGNNVASASFERTSSRNGMHENIGSTTVTLGPLRIPLPFEARSTFLSSITTGARVGRRFSRKDSILPYLLGSATTRQILPFADSGSTLRLSPVLALQHTIAASSRQIPAHEAKAMGIATHIRGCGPDGGVVSSIKGTAELRFPIRYSHLADASVIVFGDWYCVQHNSSDPFNGKSSIGIGFRKIVQGLPLKYDFCYTSDGKIKSMFGLGPDFEA